jgi:predicted ester cyclase
MTGYSNKEIVRRLVEEVYNGAVEKLDELVAESCVDHGRWNNRDGLKRVLHALRIAYPRLEFSVRDMLAEDDKVAARIRCDCREQPASGCPEKVIHSTNIFRLSEGKVVEHGGHSDSFF